MTAPYIQLRTDIRKDERVDALAEIAGYTAVAGERGGRRMAIGALVELWTHCSDRGLADAPDNCDGYAVSEPVIRHFIGPRGVEAILAGGCDELALGVRRDDGLIYLRGTSVTVTHLRAASAGGKAKSERSKRSPGGRFQPGGDEGVSEPTTRPAGHQPDSSQEPAGHQPLSSDPRSQIPDPRSQSPESTLPRVGTHAIPPVAASTWSARQSWWLAMLESESRLSADGVDATAPPLPRVCAGENEKLVASVARGLAESGYDAAAVDAKMRHIVAVAEAEARREGHRRWFKPAVIWDPVRASRAADTSIGEARAPRHQRAGPSASSTRTGRVEPARPEEYPEGDQQL